MKENNQTPGTEVFKNLAEAVVTKNASKNDSILKQMYILAYNVRDMGNQLTSNGFRRVWRGVMATMTGEKVELKNELEKQMVSQINNWVGLKVHLICDDENLMTMVKKDMLKMRDMMEKKAKEEEFAAQEVVTESKGE